MIIRQGLRLAKIGSTLLLLKTSLMNPLLLRQLEIALNSLVREQPKTHTQLDALNGKIINISLRGIQVEWYMLVLEKQIVLNPGLHTQPAVHIKIDTLALPLHLLRKGEKHPIQFEGDFTAVLQLQGLSQSLDLDFYPTLVNVLGSQPATMLLELKELVFEHINSIQAQLRTVKKGAY